MLSYAQFTQKRIKDVLNKNSNKLNSVLINKIRNTNTALNSVNLFVGKKGSGKSVAVTNEIIKISENLPEAHLLVYINKDGSHRDKAFEELKELINLPIVWVSWNDAVELLEKIFEYKNLYDQIKKNNLEDQLGQNHMEELAEALYIEDLSRPFLHTLILFEDTANSPLLKKPLIKSILAEARHYSVTCFLPVQYFKSLDSSIKDNANTIYYFAGFAPRSFYYFLSQVAVQGEHKELFNMYSRLPPTGLMVINADSGDVIFTDRDNL